jgi:ferredoxin--NADP+ reductase
MKRIAVVGAGPAGMYAAEALSKSGRVEVDILDRLPVPCGLVRYGVAPDHLSIRSVRDTLDGILDLPGVRFLGNVEVGRDVSVAQLCRFYDAIIWCYGAPTDRSLGIEGEDLAGSVSATALVNWYTGHPDADRSFDTLLNGPRVATVIGVGNVAVDVARILISPADTLRHTEMPEYVLAALEASTIEHVHILGRRGPAQATFTTKELKELGEIPGVRVRVEERDLVRTESTTAVIEGDKVAARNLAVLEEWGVRTWPESARTLSLHFYARPERIRGTDAVEGLDVVRTSVDSRGSAHDTDETWDLPTDLVIRSVGYRGESIPGVPFDTARGVIPNADGRVLDGAERASGHYTAGWIKRGPSGIIGTNKKDATATVAALLEDLDGLPEAPERGGLESFLASASIPTVDRDGWRRISREECARGAATGRDRVTIHDRGELLRIAD